MDMEVSVESLSESFGFLVSPDFVKAIEAAHARSPDNPHRGLDKFGLELGGPLYAFVGGDSAQSLRCPQMPPEFFPFAFRRTRPAVYIGFLVDHPSQEGSPNTTYAICVPEHPERSGVVARNEQELFRWLGAHLDDLDALGITRRSNAYDPEEVKSARNSMVTYQTADRMGVVVPEENSPLALLHPEMRSILIEQRDPARVRQAGFAAIKVNAPGATLALARDITWFLGHREHWYQLAIELYVEAYASLKRPLLTRIVRREWVRLFGNKGE
ncbi:MAG: hypothetical protein WC314_11815 [Vulcanimicrobiota bacterium]